MPKTYIIIPCYNEARRIGADGFVELAKLSSDANLIFVDDGSTDNTADVLRSLADKIGKNAEVLILPTNTGKGEAVRSGLCQAIDQGATQVGYIDADMATPATEVCRLINVHIDQPVDVVLGSRVALLGHRIDRSPVRHYLGRVFATAASLTLNLSVYDTQCGAKFFGVSDALKTALSDPFCSRWAFDVELIGRLNSLVGAPRIREFPLHEWQDHGGSTLSPVAMVRAFVDLLKIRRNLQKFARR